MQLIHPIFAAGGTITNPAITGSNFGKGGTPTGTAIIGQIISNAFMAMIIIGAVVLIAMIIWSGIALMTSGDNKERVQGAQKRLTYAIIGFIIIVCVFAIASFVGNFFGLTWFKTFNLPFPTPTN